MEADQEKTQNEFVKKLVQESGYEEVGNGFTESVMKQIGKEAFEGNPIKYKSLIPSHIWLAIGLSVIGICGFLLSSDGGNGPFAKLIPYTESLNDLELVRQYVEVNIQYLDNINIYNTAVYAMLMLSVFLYLQFILLKKKLL